MNGRFLGRAVAQSKMTRGVGHPPKRRDIGCPSLFQVIFPKTFAPSPLTTSKIAFTLKTGNVQGLWIRRQALVGAFEQPTPKSKGTLWLVVVPSAAAGIWRNAGALRRGLWCKHAVDSCGGLRRGMLRAQHASSLQPSMVKGHQMAKVYWCFSFRGQHRQQPKRVCDSVWALVHALGLRSV